MSESESVKAGIEEAMRGFRDAHEAYRRRRALVIPAACGPCALDSQTMAACPFVADEGCKHQGALADRERAKVRASRASAGGVPQRFLREIESIEPCASLAVVRQVLSGRIPIAILLGTTGAGKSLSAARAVAERGGVFVSASSLSGNGERVDETMAVLEEAQLAVLDDVGRGRSATPAALERTEEVTCNRFDRGIITILTSNLLPWRANEGSPPGFWDLFGGEHGRIADRLGGTDRVTICTEKSRRRNPRNWQEGAEK